MSVIVLLVLVALLIPILGIVVDSPIGRAFARRLEGPQEIPPALTELAKKIELLEADVDDLTPRMRMYSCSVCSKTPPSAPPCHRRRVPDLPGGAALPSRGHRRRGYPAEPAPRTGSEPDLRPLSRHLGCG